MYSRSGPSWPVVRWLYLLTTNLSFGYCEDYPSNKVPRMSNSTTLENAMSHTSIRHTLSKTTVRWMWRSAESLQTCIHIHIWKNLCLKLDQILRIYPPSFQLRPPKHASPIILLRVSLYFGTCEVRCQGNAVEKRKVFVPGVFFFLPSLSNAPHVLYGLRGLPSWAWQKCNRLLRLGHPWGAVTLSRWCEWWYRRM